MSKKLTIEEMQVLAENIGSRCLSKIYVNSHTKLTWECSDGHQWKARPVDIKRGHWCPVCAKEKKGASQRLDIEAMERIAKLKGGKCLSSSYKNSKTKLLWECSNGHQWETAPSNVCQGHWCPVCAGNVKGSIIDMQIVALERGGRCLSEIYINDSTKLLWECSEGHQWKSTPNAIKSGRWCPKCGIQKRSEARKLPSEIMHQLAKEKGGRCLSKVYVNSSSKLHWECSKGHRWYTRLADIKKGHWCPHCSGIARLTIEEMQEIANNRGGKCLSKNYKNNRTLLQWQCAEGHRWEAKPDHIVRGRWCPQCSSGLGERICRAFFEQIFQRNFSKTRPEWLINNKGNQMELDGYCEELNLAFEHQGEQHYSTKVHFIRSEDELKQRQKDDQLKLTLCKQKGITLIHVSEIPSRLSIENIKEFIKEECKANNISLPNNFDFIQIDLKPAYISTLAKEMLSQLQTIARERGGKCLSNYYVNDNTKLLWECAEGHQWEAIPNSIKNGRWCPICIGKHQTIENMQELAMEKGGKCLSNDYLGSKNKLLWECAKGHQWEAIPNSIKNGRWCPQCGIKRRSQMRKLTITDMRKLAFDKGGECLSEKYVNSNTKLLWKCAKGHQWEAVPSAVKSRTWCPVCSGNSKLTIEDMHNLAAQKHGVCLSKRYINRETKLLWKCAEGHQWEATPSNIKSGYWCPYCSRIAKLTIEEMQKLKEKDAFQSS
jgi:hypothetical protein